jgi:hypothetical protein
MSEAEATVRPDWLDTVVAKFAAVDTMRLYDAAPVTVPQLRLSEIGWLTAPLVGAERVGATGAAMIVVKLHAPDQPLVPPIFAAFTSQ